MNAKVIFKNSLHVFGCSTDHDKVSFKVNFTGYIRVHKSKSTFPSTSIQNIFDLVIVWWIDDENIFQNIFITIHSFSCTYGFSWWSHWWLSVGVRWWESGSSLTVTWRYSRGKVITVIVRRRAWLSVTVGLWRLRGRVCFLAPRNLSEIKRYPTFVFRKTDFFIKCSVINLATLGGFILRKTLNVIKLIYTKTQIMISRGKCFLSNWLSSITAVLLNPS